MVEPLGRVVDFLAGAGIDVGDDQGQRPTTGAEPAGRFVPPHQVGCDQHRQAQLLHLRGGVGVGLDADDERLVGVDHRPPRGGYLAGGLRLQVDGVQLPGFAVVHVRGPPRGRDGLGARKHDFRGDRCLAECRHVDGGDPGLGVEDELVALWGVGVLVEVQAGAALIPGQPDDAVPRGWVDPVGRHGLAAQPESATARAGSTPNSRTYGFTARGPRFQEVRAQGYGRHVPRTAAPTPADGFLGGSG